MKMNLKYFVATVLCIITVAGCEKVEETPSYPIAPVTAHERDTLRTLFSYNERGVSVIQLYANDALVSSTSAYHTPSGIRCTNLNGIDYDIQWDATIGGARTREVNASIGNALLYRVEYFYDDKGRLKQADLHGAESSVVYVMFEYGESSITINDNGTKHEIQLSNEENTGNVCNVMAFSEAYYTTRYIINQDLYFLNIYGTPTFKLPVGVEVVRQNDKLVKAGKYHYEY